MSTGNQVFKFSSFILLQPFEIAIQTTYKKQITWNGNNGRTLRDRNPAN